MKNIVLLTAKGGNQSIPNKNLLEVAGRTFLGWQLYAAQNAGPVDAVFVSTECPLLKAESEKYGAVVIDRPSELAQAFTNHGDVIKHGAMEAQKIMGVEIDTVTILLGNTAMNRPEDIEAAIEAVANDQEADGAMTVWRAQDDHPYRAMTIADNGYLVGFMPSRNIDTNRQSYPEAFYYDQGPWTVRYHSLMAAERGRTGPSCWWWMGDKVIPLVRPWVTGKDVHSQLDVEISRTWLTNELWRVS